MFVRAYPCQTIIFNINVKFARCICREFGWFRSVYFFHHMLTSIDTLDFCCENSVKNTSRQFFKKHPLRFELTLKKSSENDRGSGSGRSPQKMPWIQVWELFVLCQDIYSTSLIARNEHQIVLLSFESKSIPHRINIPYMDPMSTLYSHGEQLLIGMRNGHGTSTVLNSAR